MAANIERLVVQLSADIKRYENAMAKAQGVSTKTATRIQKDFTAANKNVQFATANVAAQFQDIGVQLAGGQSPFLIALQQGTQLSAALGNGGLKGTLGLLGGAFTSLISPVSLLTIGIIGLGGVAVQKLADWYAAGDRNAKQLEEHAKAVDEIAKKWGDAVPSIKAYAAAIQDAADKAKLLEVANGLAVEKLEPVLPIVTDLRAEVAAAATDFYALGASQDGIAGLQAAIAELHTKTVEGTASADDYKRVQDLLAGLVATGTTPAIDSLSASLAANVSAFNDAADAANRFRTEAAAAANMQLGPLGGLSPLTSNDGQFMNPAQQQDWRANNTRSQTQIEAEKNARNSSAGAARKEAEAIAALISELEFEQSLLSMSAVERERETALRRAGAAATDEQRQKIAELVETIYAAKQANEATETAARAAAEAQKQLGQIGQQAVNGFVTALADGKLEGAELVQILGNVVTQLIQMKGFSGLFSSLFGGGFSPTGGGFASMLGLPGFANGTNFAPGGLAIVGERGPELVNLPRGSQVIPRVPKMASSGGGAAGVNFSPTYNIDARGADEAAVSRLERGLAKTNAEMESRIINTVRKAQRNNVKLS